MPGTFSLPNPFYMLPPDESSWNTALILPFRLKKYFVSIHYILKSIILNQVFTIQSCLPLFPSCTIHSNQINVQALNCPTFQPLLMLSLRSPYIQILSHPERLSSTGPIALEPFLIPIFIIRSLCALSILEKNVFQSISNIWSCKTWR